MKKTVWEMDPDTSLNYSHGSEEIWISQNTGIGNGATTNEVLLADNDVSALILALGELKVLLDAEKIARLEDAA